MFGDVLAMDYTFSYQNLWARARPVVNMIRNYAICSSAWPPKRFLWKPLESITDLITLLITTRSMVTWIVCKIRIISLIRANTTCGRPPSWNIWTKESLCAGALSMSWRVLRHICQPISGFCALSIDGLPFFLTQDAPQAAAPPERRYEVCFTSMCKWLITDGDWIQLRLYHTLKYLTGFGYQIRVCHIGKTALFSFNFWNSANSVEAVK